MPAEAEQVVGLLGVLHQLLELVADVTLEEAEEGPVHVQGVDCGDVGADEELEGPTTMTTQETDVPQAPDGHR